LSKNNYINNKNEKDVIYALYNKKLLTIERLQFLMKYSNFNVSSNLIKILIKNSEISLLYIIFGYLKFFYNDFILQLLFYYKNKITISTIDFNQQISNDKFKILINTE